MKKLNRKEMIILLQNKGNKTFKELSILSGYHEKSLVRISRAIEKGKYSSIHGNVGRIPYNKIDNQEKKHLLELYQKGNYSSKKEFYCYLRFLGYSYSYSFIAKIIEKTNVIKITKKQKKYFCIPRKAISENKIQYQNKRYWIDTDVPIAHHESLLLYIEKETQIPLYIKYQGKKYGLFYEKTVHSKKGTTKY